MLRRAAFSERATAEDACLYLDSVHRCFVGIGLEVF